MSQRMLVSKQKQKPKKKQTACVNAELQYNEPFGDSAERHSTEKSFRTHFMRPKKITIDLHLMCYVNRNET